MHKLFIYILVTSFITACSGRSTAVRTVKVPTEPEVNNSLEDLETSTFDYIRGMNRSVVCDQLLVLPASEVIPSTILDLAPDSTEGLTLTFNGIDSPFWVYLIKAGDGSHTPFELVNRRWVASSINPLVFAEDDYIAVVPITFFDLVDVVVIGNALAAGQLLTFDKECWEISLLSVYLYLGRNFRIDLR